ncbi:MAG: hypothetical protein ACHQ52_06300 [Candidatus Eisenbacteria bacterium]
MRTNVWMWTVAIVLTLFLAVWQRVSGPTYPVSGTATLGASSFHYRLERTHAGAGDHVVRVDTGPIDVSGTVEWRDHAPAGSWHAVPMIPLSTAHALAAPIPHHAAPQKVDYRITLRSADATLVLPPAGMATLRFRNDVPAWVLIPHILVMMGALLLAVRVALEALRPAPDLRILTLRTLAATFLGGFPLGMAVSAYAFRQPWGGFPLGNDATDNKTLLAFLGWLVAAIVVMRAGDPRRARPIVLAAALLMLVVYLVPHSFTMGR